MKKYPTRKRIKPSGKRGPDPKRACPRCGVIYTEYRSDGVPMCRPCIRCNSANFSLAKPPAEFKLKAQAPLDYVSGEAKLRHSQDHKRYRRGP